MCGRFVLDHSMADLVRHFELEAGSKLAPRFNVAPTQDIAVVLKEPEAGRQLRFQRWGLVPSWAKDSSIGNRMINARSETAADKPAFRKAFRERRCLVPASGFYEWKGRKGQARRPHLFRRTDGHLLGLAGLWESWRGEEGEPMQSCTILTTEANSAVRPTHHRMPVILDPRDYARWLDPALRDADDVQALLVPCPPDWVGASEVTTRVNDPRVDDAACAEPLDP